MTDENEPHTPRSRTYPRPVEPQHIIVTHERNGCVFWMLVVILAILVLPFVLIMLAGLVAGVTA